MANAGPAFDPFAAIDLPTRVQSALDGFLDRQAAALDEVGPDAALLVAAARETVNGGKRLRAAFCYWGWRAAGGEDDDRVIVAAAALELLHASALVHDDVMDASDVRRGRPAAHRHFATLYAEQLPAGAAEPFGTGAAILLGDLLLSWAGQLLRSSVFGAVELSRALPCFDALCTEVIAGQFLDVLAQASGRESMPQAMRVLRYKAAKYTVERPLHLGAALAGADEALIAALSAYGIPLGEAFQLRDDVLGVFGDPASTGKPAGDDLREGKRTVLTARAMAAAGARDRALLRDSIGNRRLSQAGVDQAREALQRTGAVGDVEHLIAQLTAAATAALVEAPIRDAQAREALHALIDLTTSRTR